MLPCSSRLGFQAGVFVALVWPERFECNAAAFSVAPFSARPLRPDLLSLQRALCAPDGPAGRPPFANCTSVVFWRRAGVFFGVPAALRCHPEPGRILDGGGRDLLLSL